MKHLIAQSPLNNLLSIFKDIAEIYHCHPYLTGGSVRDLLLNRKVKDWDITVTGDINKIAKVFAEKINGKLIVLDEFFQTFRIIKKDFIFDFTSLKGNNISEDLRFRDYTIDALAIDLLNPVSIIDPLGGLSDLEKRQICLISPSALSSDPLRILRAFRIAAELNFSLDEYTPSALKASAYLLEHVAKERIRQEFDLLFSVSNTSYWLSEMGKSGIFKVILPEIEALKGIKQNGFHHLDIYEHSLLSLLYMENILDNPGSFFFTHLDKINTYLKDHKCHFYLKWAALCHDLGKPSCQARLLTPERLPATLSLARRAGSDGGQAPGSKRTTFYGHDRVGAEIFSNMANRLRFSKKDSDVITLLILHHMRPFYLLHIYQKRALTLRAIHRLIRVINPHVIGLFLLAVADSLATKEDRKPACQKPDMADRPKDYEEYLSSLFNHVMNVYESYLQIKEKPRLVTGRDIQAWFSLPPCPKVGVLLKQIEMAQISGEVSTKEEAKAWLEEKFKMQNEKLKIE